MMRLIITIFIVVAISLLIAIPAMSATPELQLDTNLSTEGYYRLTWQTDANTKLMKSDYILQEANEPTFTDAATIYQGPDTASVISGRSNGFYYYRIRNTQDTGTADVWSNMAKVEVAHHSLSRAFIFFTLGAMVFVTTLTAVIIGNRSQQS